MDPQKITELANLLRNNGDKILSSEFTLTLSGSLLRALNDSFALIADNVDIGSTQQTFQVVKPINSKSNVFRDLQLVHDFVQKTALLCIVHYSGEHYYDGAIDIVKFRTLKRLEVQKTNIRQIVGIQPLRAQLQQLICVKSLQSVEDIITRCGGDNSNGFVWNELKIADFSYNNLQTVDSSLEFAQYLQHLNLRHNQLRSVNAIKWLPHLKTLDLSFNRLQSVPQFHMEAYKRLQSLNMSNNFVEDLMGVEKLDALTDLDLSDNCLLEHSNLLPLSALLTLKFLNLYGNPLHCHPKHRLATAQYLHKNTATVKFILDFETLSKSEKALTGQRQLRHVGALNRYAQRASSTSINTGRHSSATNTPASSIGSLRSFKLLDSTDAENVTTASTIMVESQNGKRRLGKVRTVDIEEDERAPECETAAEPPIVQPALQRKNSTPREQMSKSLLLVEETNEEHLETKKHIETLRKKYGAEWLQTGNAEMMNSVLGIEVMTTSVEECHKSRQLFNDYLGEFSADAMSVKQQQQRLSETVQSSTPKDESQFQSKFALDTTPIKSIPMSATSSNKNESTVFVSLDAGTNSTVYDSVTDSVQEQKKGNESTKMPHVEVEADDEPAHLKNVYASTTENDEPTISDTEPDEDCYIVYSASKNNESIFLTMSTKFLREKDTITQRTRTKWSLQILESCDRIKSNMLRINFDTVKKDKQERVYTVEDGLCQELERKLRHILSQRDLTDMNIIVYRCVNCNSQFTREHKHNYHTEIRCPDCKSTFIAEIHDLPKSFDKANLTAHEKLSPATIVEESPVTIPIVLEKAGSRQECLHVEDVDDSNSIGSANSLNESSSCSKITHSQTSFDSNQSVVGSSNTERDIEFKTNCYESDIDIISNPSQSSIEVLDQMQHSSRKTSEERRLLHIPHLETIDDYNYTQRYTTGEFGLLSPTTSYLNAAMNPTAKLAHDSTNQPQKPTQQNGLKSPTSSNATLVGVTLTESSSSGSVTDSICTAYEQQAAVTALADSAAVHGSEQIVRSGSKCILQHLLAEENNHKQIISSSNNSSSSIVKTKESNDAAKKEDSSLSSMFGALFQSTNILMSSSKKLIDAEASLNIQTGLTISRTRADAAAALLHSKSSCQPYKFNYTDFNDIDHRLKLYFYQTKFEEAGEHFKWIARGRIYNESTQTLCDGIVVMSTCKCYLIEIFAAENDDVTKWLRLIASVTVDRLESIQLLPWKFGLSFELRDWGSFLLLLQDILRTDSLLLFFANNSLPTQCELKYQPAERIMQRLTTAVIGDQLKMCCLLSGCEISCESARRTFDLCALLTTDTHLYLSSSKLDWLAVHATDCDIELCCTQLMSNLVEVEHIADNLFIVNFLDETSNKCELWHITFETKEIAESCFNAIGQSWEKLFGVPLMSA